MESSFLLSKQANPHRFQQEAQKQNLTLPGRCCWQSTSLKAALLERNVQFLFLLGVLAVISSSFLSFPIEVSEQQAKPSASTALRLPPPHPHQLFLWPAQSGTRPLPVSPGDLLFQSSWVGGVELHSEAHGEWGLSCRREKDLRWAGESTGTHQPKGAFTRLVHLQSDFIQNKKRICVLERKN